MKDKDQVFYYYEGQLQALWLYAWHKDGAMFVGCGVRTYAEEKARIEAERDAALAELGITA